MIAAALLAAAMAGCGSGDGDDRLDAAELASRADELCRSGQQRFAAIQKTEPASPQGKQPGRPKSWSGSPGPSSMSCAPCARPTSSTPPTTPTWPPRAAALGAA